MKRSSPHPILPQDGPFPGGFPEDHPPIPDGKIPVPDPEGRPVVPEVLPGAQKQPPRWIL